MDLGEVFKTHLGGDQQGQLVIKFVGEDHLCKISVEDGQAIYLTLGTMGPADTLDAIVGKVAEWSNFIKGLPARKRLDEPVNGLLLNIAGAAPPAPGAAPAANDENTAETPAIEVSGTIEPDRVSAAIEHFIDQVGPLGTILAEKICTNLAYAEGGTMGAETFTRFVAALAAEVPDDDRQSFIEAVTS